MELEDKHQRVIDEIMKYKELLDNRIITEEEFSICKKAKAFKIIFIILYAFITLI
ncbi:hypothetical protein KPL37_18235 [Clostridium frigoris]|uniref:Short C-terminal domain-containing protein n=1 Tax=Clostridium frigoris TaxID=205327 RepID=A0ABS6BYI6_9CLOT|nr:hypothetical protein [Clostridium frigoris]MBU3161639.1 hypothetical protein [Clostridium frigoris]